MVARFPPRPDSGNGFAAGENGRDMLIPPFAIAMSSRFGLALSGFLAMMNQGYDMKKSNPKYDPRRSDVL